MGEYVFYKLLAEKIKSEKERGKRVVLTGGCFDILHSGHLYLFRRARQFGDVLVVNVVNDERVKIYKGIDRPIIEDYNRAWMISDLKTVDYVTIHPSLQGPTTDLALLIKPDVIVKSNRWEIKEIISLRKKLGPKVRLERIMRSDEPISTTDIIEKILARYIPEIKTPH